MNNTVASSRTYATSLLKGIQILNLFCADRPEWRVGEMSLAIGAAKSTISRIARTLESQAYLVRSRQKDGFRLGIRMWELGNLAIHDKSEFAQRVLPYLEDLLAKLGQSVQAAILDGTDVVYVQKVDASHSLRTYIPLGARFPTYCTATGKALLAYQPPASIDRVVRSGLKSFTKRSVTTAAALRAELESVRKRGYAMTRGEWRGDIGGVAAPVFDRTGQVIGAIGVTMPLTHFSRDARSPAALAVVQAARGLSVKFGFQLKPGRMQGAKSLLAA
ncbi:MAG: IclR family transcriptional regulator [Betaproteobacteria bacterium]|nr:IclR family transcriptional regulator [Betaproteobacteria bacterium]